MTEKRNADARTMVKFSCREYRCQFSVERPSYRDALDEYIMHRIRDHDRYEVNRHAQ